MNTKLDHEEFKITYLITRNAIAHAAQSLSKLLHDDVKLLKMELTENHEALKTHPPQEIVYSYVLKTDIYGEFRAQSNLIISEKEASKIWEITQPANFSLQEEMQEAILLELDNILTASVISEMANILNMQAFGGVPKLEKKAQLKITEDLIRQENMYEYNFFLNTVFKCHHTEINPTFIWFFKEDLVSTIRKVVQNPENYPGLSKIGEFYSDQHFYYE